MGVYLPGSIALQELLQPVGGEAIYPWYSMASDATCLLR
jgi:hypothetical protein